MHLNYFFTHCEVEKKLSKKTIEAYKSDLNQFSRHVSNKFGVYDLRLITKQHLKDHFIFIKKYSPRTIKRKIATLKVFFNFLEYEDKITENPFDKINFKIKIKKSLPVVLSLNEIESIIKKTYELKNNQNASPSSIRNIAIIELLFATGIRVSELCFLKKENISNDYSSIKILGKGNKERIIPITNEFTVKAIKNYYSEFKDKIHTNEYFFINRLNNRLSEQSVRYLVKKISTVSGINRNITPHVFRHTFATLLLEANVNIRYIQELLGHSSINITQIYTHVSNKKTFEILQLKHPRNKIVYN